MFALVLPICSQIQQSRSHCSLQTWSNPIKKTSSQHYNKSGPALDFCFVLPRCLTRNISSHIHVTEAEEMLICPPVGNTWLNPRDTSPILLNIHPAACSPALTPRCNSRLLTDEKPPPPSFFLGNDPTPSKQPRGPRNALNTSAASQTFNSAQLHNSVGHSSATAALLSWTAC